eukprot:scaffold17108_cov33-Phaeocystis_antarctica.AAC.1
MARSQRTVSPHGFTSERFATAPRPPRETTIDFFGCRTAGKLRRGPWGQHINQRWVVGYDGRFF